MIGLKEHLPVLDEPPILLHVTRPGFSVVTVGRPVLCAEGSFTSGLSELAVGMVEVAFTLFVLDDDVGPWVVELDRDPAGDVKAAADEAVAASPVSAKWLKSVGATVTNCPVGFGFGFGDFVVRLNVLVTSASSGTLVSGLVVLMVDDAVEMFVMGLRVASGVAATVLLGALTGRLTVEDGSTVGRLVGGIL